MALGVIGAPFEIRAPAELRDVAAELAGRFAAAAGSGGR